jgi:D-beta-D-heptose 7-phosphate kinase/D-beta-D-heptose 1-phosphate adenosyltransferase
VAGGAANVAANIVALGGRAALVGLIGADEAGKQLKTVLSDQGVLVESLVEEPGRITTVKTRIRSGRHQLVRIDREHLVPPCSSAASQIMAAVERALCNARIVVISDYAKGCLADPLVGDIIRLCKDAGRYVVVDPKRQSFLPYIGADLIKPNRSELAAAAGRSCVTDAEVEAAAADIVSATGSALLVTRDAAGMSLVRADKPPLHIETTIQEVADVSGAGDAVLAALAVWLSEGAPLERAVDVANRVGGIAVRKVGTTAVSRSEVERAINQDMSRDLHPGAIVSDDEAGALAQRWRRGGETVVFTNGCFDLVHSGHVELLAAAAAEGDRLILGLNSDRSVARLKGPSRPIQSELARARVLGALRMVDLIVIFDQDSPVDLIRRLRPDVLVKGADYTAEQVVGGDYVTGYGGRVKLVPLVAGQSSTRLIETARASA